MKPADESALRRIIKSYASALESTYWQGDGAWYGFGRDVRQTLVSAGLGEEVKAVEADYRSRHPEPESDEDDA